MSTTRRGGISLNSRVITVLAVALGMTLSLVVISSNTQQNVLAQQVTGVHQNATKTVENNNAPTMTLGSQLDNIAGSQFMMQWSSANPWMSMTGSSDMMDMMTNMMDMMTNMMMPSMPTTEASSNSSEMMTNSMEGPWMDMMGGSQ